MKIYLAGPLFTSAEREWNVKLARLLEVKGIEVWLPQENEPRDKTPKDIFAMDVEGIWNSDIVVAIMDGPDPDSGTCWECGFAYGIGIPVVTIRTDFRSANDGSVPFNLMMSESSEKVILCPKASVEVVADKIEDALNKLEEKLDESFDCFYDEIPKVSKVEWPSLDSLGFKEMC